MTNMSPEERNNLQNRADYALGRGGAYVERRFENLTVDMVARLGYPYRGADYTLSALVTSPQSESWLKVDDKGEAMVGRLLRGSMNDLGVLPRLRELDQTLTYSVSSGPALLLNDVRISVDRATEIVEVIGSGNDIITKGLEGYRNADARHHHLTEMRDVVQGKIAPEKGPSPSSDVMNRLVEELNVVDLALMEEGVNVGVRQGALEDDLKILTLSNESLKQVLACKGDLEKTKELLTRLRDKRKVVMKVEQGVMGINEVARFLPQLVSMQTDLGGIIKVFTGPEPAISSHLLRFLSISPKFNEATTIAMREILKLCYPKTDGKGGVLADSKLTTDGGIKKSITAEKYTPEKRDRFFEVWEDVVQKQLQEKKVFGSVKLAEDAVSLSCFLMEAFTLGQTAYIRDRKTGKKIGDDEAGSGSMYDKGGVDTVDKVHQLQDRKWGEAVKGRISPRPGVIKGLSQELLFSIFQYTEAKKDGKPMNMSVLNALISEGNDNGYTIGDFVENLTSGGHFSYMLYAFRACQISDKLDQLVNGRISAVKELGGGPEKLVEDMIDTLQGLGKAFQTIPFGRDAIEPWMANSENKTVSDKAKEIKKIEITRNIINMFSDFYRGAVAGSPGFGGYEDNPGWRGVIDLLPLKVYERLVVYTNLLTPQQFYFALEMAKDIGAFNMGGVLTEEITYGQGVESEVLRKILSQDASVSSESLINLVKAHGFEGTAENMENINSSIRSLINKSAKKVQDSSVMPDKTLIQRAKRKNAKLTKQLNTV